MINIKSLVNEVLLKEQEENLKRQTIAFVGGSLKPPHKGHWDMVEEYAKFADKVVVLISTPSLKSIRKTKTGIVITPEMAKQILEIYKDAYHLDNVVIDISAKPSPLPGIIDYMNKHDVKNANIILGASDKDDDWKRWTAPYIKGIIERIEKEPKNIKFLDPQKYATHHHSSNKGATYVRNNIDNFDVVKEYLPSKLNTVQQKQVFDILNPQQLAEGNLDTARKGLTKIYQLNFTGIRNLFKAIIPSLQKPSGLQMNVIPKSDGSAVRIAWDNTTAYIESSHSGMVSDPKKIAFVPGFSETLQYLQQPEVLSRFQAMLKGNYGIKLVGELLYNAKEYQDLDQTITFVGTKYDSTKLGKVATIILFDAMKMQGDSLVDLSPVESQKTIDYVCKNLSDANLSFMSNKSFAKPISISIDDFSAEAQQEFNEIDSLSNQQLDALRNEFEALMIKHCQNVQKPEIVKTDIIEGIVFEIPGLGEFAVQNPKWVDTKHQFYKYRTAFDDLVLSFIKNVTTWQQKKKILSVFDKSKAQWQERYSELLPEFKTNLEKAYNDFIAHKSEIPNFVFQISKKLVDDVYQRMSNLTDDIESLRTALTINKANESGKALLEGGTLFPNASRISQLEVKPTLEDIDQNLLSLFKISIAKNQAAPVGSTGKKLDTSSSGDIDIGIDAAVLQKALGTSNMKDAFAKMKTLLDSANVEYHAVPKFNEVSVLWPISSNVGKTGKFVQVDLMPVDDLEYLSKFGEYAPAEMADKTQNQPKSAVRNQILMQMAKVRDQSDKTADAYTQYEFSPRDGLLQHTFSNVGKSGKRLAKAQKIGTKVVTTDPAKILQIIFNDKSISAYGKHLTASDTWNEFINSDIGRNPALRQKVAQKIVAELNPSYAGAHAIPTPQEIIDVADGKEPRPMDLGKFNSANESVLKEGGNAVSDVVRINRANVKATFEAAQTVLLPLLGIDKKDTCMLGSAGKKATSGDIDFGIDKVVDVRAFLEKAHKIFDEKDIENTPSYGLNEISIRWPISNVDGLQSGQFVQIDFMPAQNIKMLQWGMHSPTAEESPFKGVIRNLLLCDIAAYTDIDIQERAEIDGIDTPVEYDRYVLLTQRGLFRKHYSLKGKKLGTYKKTPTKTDEKFISDDPTKIIKTIFGNSAKPEDVMTIDGLWNMFLKSPQYKNKNIRNAILKKTLDEFNKRGYVRGKDYPDYITI